MTALVTVWRFVIEKSVTGVQLDSSTLVTVWRVVIEKGVLEVIVKATGTYTFSLLRSCFHYLLLLTPQIIFVGVPSIWRI